MGDARCFFSWHSTSSRGLLTPQLDYTHGHRASEPCVDVMKPVRWCYVLARSRGDSSGVLRRQMVLHGRG